jgi:GT2 family glycosyltransferase
VLLTNVARCPGASVIVCTSGRGHLLAGCLESIAAGLRSGDELIVVESGGDAARSALADLELNDARAIHLGVEPPGKSRQLNVGARVATGTVLLLTDDDVRVPSRWVDEMTAPFDDALVGVAFGAVQGLTRVPESGEAPMLPAGEAPFETWRYAHAASMAVRRSTLFDLGGFDERLGPGAPAHGEEHDLVFRARRRGWRVVIAAATPARHVGWRSAAQERRNALVYERGGGAVVGAAIRRSVRDGWPVLSARLAYQLRIFTEMNRRFGLPAFVAFSRGFLYGIRLKEHDWLRTGADPPAATVVSSRRRAR